MDDAFVFYAYWNGNQIRDLFEGLVSVTAGSGFVQLAAFLVVTGLVAALLIGAVKGEGKHVISYFACAVLFWFVAIVPKATVVIEDVRSHTVYNVDNVPLSMAFFASVSSRIGHWLTQAYETAFIPADVAKYSSFGAVYPQRVILEPHLRLRYVFAIEHKLQLLMSHTRPPFGRLYPRDQILFGHNCCAKTQY